MEKYKELFIDESKERLNSLDDNILKLEKDPSDANILDEIFRVAHTLKGMAAAMGFKDIAELTHHMEDILDIIREGKAEINDNVISVLFDCRDVLFQRVEDIEENNEFNDDFEETIQYINSIREELLGGNKTSSKEDKSEKTSEELKTPVNNLPETKSDTLLIYHPAPGFFTKEEEEKFKQEILKGKFIVRFLIKLTPTCEMKYVRAFMAIKKIKTDGEILKIFPNEKELKEEKFGNEFDIFLIINDLESTKSIQGELLLLAELEEITPMKVEFKTKKEKEKESAKRNNAGKEKDLSVQHIRVSIKSLDNLINLIGELLISKIRLDKINQKYSIKELKESLTNINRVVFDLQDEIMGMRMIAVSHVFDIFPRMVRDLSKSLEKNINFVMEGRDIELDRTLLDEIGEPLVHLLRNAVDHGIESGDEREAYGKSRVGEIKLSAYRERNNVIIEVSDDGKGINFDKFRDKAVAKGLITIKESQNMTINDLKQLILKGGISTKSEITQVSGRGVGMGVVRQKIESMGGAIDIDSIHGKGTKFIIKLPLTVAIIHSLLVSLRGTNETEQEESIEEEILDLDPDMEKIEKIYEEIYAIPINNIVRSLVIRKDQIQSINNKNVLYMFDRIIPLVNLRKVVNFDTSTYSSLENQKEDERYTIVIVETGDTEFGLVVDKLLGQQEIVIKDLGHLLKNTKGVSGGTILGDGKVAIILDVATML
jgi:two-component system chemotaxis sensor kinase CheA